MVVDLGKQFWPRLWPALVIVPLLVTAALFDHVQVEHRRDEAHRHVASVIGVQRARLEAYLNARINHLHGLAALVAMRPDISAGEFAAFGGKIISELGGIRAIQLAPGAVVTQVVPREGNEDAIGHDLLADPARRAAAERAIAGRSIIIAGPYTLRQGGEGLIARQPIFVAGDQGERFWGFSIVVLDMPAAYRHTGTAESMDGVRIAIRGRDGLGAAGGHFFGDPGLFRDDAVRVEVTFASGTWEIAALPDQDWPNTWWGRPALVAAALALCLAFAALSVRLRSALGEAHRNEQRFRTLFDESLQLCGTVSPDGILTSANRTACDLIGRRPDEVVGLPYWETPWWSHDPVLAARLRDALRGAVDQRAVVRLAGRHPNPAGGLVDIEFSAKPLFDEDGRVAELLAEARDITERKRTEDLLGARLRLAQIMATCSLHEILVATLDEMCALTDSEIGFYHFLLPDQVTLSLQAWSTRTTREFCHAVAESKHYDVEVAGVWADSVRQRRSVVYNDYGSLSHRKGFPAGHAEVRRLMSVPIVRDGLIVAIIGVGNKDGDFDGHDLTAVETLADLAWDLTERKRAEETLVKHADLLERRYESLRALNDIAALPAEKADRQLAKALALGAEHLGLPIGIVAKVDGDTYTVLHHCAPADAGLCNGQVFALGDTYCAITLMSRDVVAIPHMGQSPHAGHPCYKAFGLEAYVGVPLLVRGQHYGTVNFSSPLPYRREFDTGDLEFMRLLARWVGSVLEREQAEADVIAAKEAAEERSEALADSNSDLEQFAYVASHDLRQPLRMVTSYLTLLERRLAATLDAEGREFIGYAREGALHMDRLILDLLEYSRVGRHGEPPGPANLAEVAADAVHLLQVSVEDAACALDVGTEPALVSGHRRELVRLFQNLIGNALKYRSPDRPPQIRVAWARHDGEWRVSVQDNGIGIPPEYHNDVFKIFRRLHGSGKYDGTGIGLAICKKIVERHGGRIWIESLATGTRFLFTVPAWTAGKGPQCTVQAMQGSNDLTT